MITIWRLAKRPLIRQRPTTSHQSPATSHNFPHSPNHFPLAPYSTALPARYARTDRMPASLSSQAQDLLHHARSSTPFCSKDGQPCASLPIEGGHRIVVALRSAAFRDWLIAEYYNGNDTAPSTAAFNAALRTLEARARYGDFPVTPVTHRLAFEGDLYLPSKIILDLANAEGEVLEITSRGWATRNNLKTAFKKSPTTLPLPIPTTDHRPPATSHQPLSSLSALFHLTPTQSLTALAWLTAALRPTGPYPILVLNGPAGSGKSVLARALRALIDPSSAPVHRLPQRDRELLQLAFNNWILVLDMVHRVPNKLSETLCAISSGDALEIRQPDQRDPLVFEVARPIILVVPHDETQRAWTPSRTLERRTLIIQLAHIAKPLPEAMLWAGFEALHAPVLGALSGAVSTALRRIRDIDLGNIERFPDSATWIAAAAPALDIDEQAVMHMFGNPKSSWAGSNPLREALYAILESTGAWTGEAMDLLKQLRDRVPLAALPSTTKGLSQALPNIAGIHIIKTREHGRRILSITKTLDASQKKAAGNERQIGITPE